MIQLLAEAASSKAGDSPTSQSKYLTGRGEGGHARTVEGTNLERILRVRMFGSGQWKQKDLQPLFYSHHPCPKAHHSQVPIEGCLANKCWSKKLRISKLQQTALLAAILLYWWGVTVVSNKQPREVMIHTRRRLTWNLKMDLRRRFSSATQSFSGCMWVSSRASDYMVATLVIIGHPSPPSGHVSGSRVQSMTSGAPRRTACHANGFRHTGGSSRNRYVPPKPPAQGPFHPSRKLLSPGCGPGGGVRVSKGEKPVPPESVRSPVASHGPGMPKNMELGLNLQVPR